MTETLQQRIARHEAFTEYPKPDAKGMWEIGYGHDITPMDANSIYANGISQESALTLLEADIDIATRLTMGALPWLAVIDELRQGILIEMCYQMGIQGLLQFKNMLQAMQSDDWEAAANAMIDSEWHAQTPARCEELAALMISDSAS